MKTLIISILFILNSLNAISQEKNVFDVARKGTVTEMETLYKENPEIINSVDERKSSPLILASYRANEPVAIFLIEKVKNINYNSGMGTALMAGVMSGNVTIIKKLIDAKADLNQVDTSGKTALIYATFFNKNEIVKILVNAGADKAIKDNDGKTALDFANFNNNTDLIILLDQ